MGTIVRMGDFATYDEVLTAYGPNSAALAALPAGSRLYAADQLAQLRRSANGKFLAADLSLNGPVSDSPANQLALFGPPHSQLTVNAGTNRLVCRTVFWKMPGNRPATIKGFQNYQTVVGAAGIGTLEFDLRLYECYPDGKPIRNRAPLYVWSFNSTGTGTGAVGVGTGTPGLVDLSSVANNNIWNEIAMPGGNRDVPANFYTVIRHNLATPASILAHSTNAVGHDAFPTITPADGTNTINRSCSYAWTEASFTLGEFAVFPTAAEVALTAVTPNLFLLELVA